MQTHTHTHTRISIQWAIIVKYGFIYLECHRLHLKASFTFFQLLSLLNLLINSTCKMDISESIQCTSQQNYNTSLHCNNTNHMSTTIKIVANKENKTVQWKEKIRNGRNQEAAPTTRVQYLYGDTLSPKVWGTWDTSFSSKPQTQWFAPCSMEDSRQHPLSN